MIEDKLACRSLWEGELACSSRAYHNTAKTLLFNLFSYVDKNKFL